MHLVWTEHAILRRREIFTYIAADDVDAARKLDEDFQQAAARLPQFPGMGRNGHVTGTREIVVRNSYILVYRVVVDTLQILTIHHAARKHPLL